MTAEDTLPPISELLPHGPQALCLDAATRYVSGERVAARLRIRSGLPLYDEELGGIPAWAAIEIMAQTVGVYVGLDARAEGRGPRVGYLIGVRRFRSNREIFVAGLELAIEADCRYSESAGLGSFDCRILEENGSTLATATLSVWRPPEKEASE